MGRSVYGVEDLNTFLSRSWAIVVRNVEGVRAWPKTATANKYNIGVTGMKRKETKN